jgi:hypothetical protein
MTVTYDQTPGTKVTIEAGSIAGVEVGEEEKLVIFGRGDTANGNAQTNSPTQVSSAGDAEAEFGDNSELTRALKDAIANGANTGYLYGVAVANQSVTGEAVAGGSGTLSNAPVVEDLSTISVQNTTDSQAADSVAFRYDSAPSAPSTANEAHLNPFTGEFEAGDSDDYDVDYQYHDWQSAFDSADMVLEEGESGVYVALSEAESVAADLYAKATALRDPDYKMVKAFAGAQPNANSSDSPPAPIYDSGNYSDALDALAGFAVAPARQDGTTDTVLGAIGGLAAGNALENPIYNDSLSGVDLETGQDDEGRLTHADRANLRSSQVMPLKNEGSITVDGTLSTDQSELWEVDFQTLRVIDRCVLIVREIGQAVRGRLDTAGTGDIAAQEAQAQLEQLADDGLLKANASGETNLYVREDESTPQGTVALEMGVTPIQAVETFEATITIA